MKDILAFLRDLAKHNNREWFEANKPRFKVCQDTFVSFNQQWLNRLSEIEPEISGLTPKDCIWRIYRDVRFSANKRPYKEWFGSFPAAGGGKHSLQGGYYLHIQPGHCLFAGGIWNPDNELLRTLRSEIYANWDEVHNIMKSADWKRYFGDFDSDRMLKRLPAPYTTENVENEQVAQWLCRKAYTFSTPFTDQQICDPNFIDQLMDICRVGKRMNDFLNYTFYR